MDTEDEAMVFEPIIVTGEGFVRTINPTRSLRVAADAYLRVRITDPNGFKKVCLRASL